MDKEYPDKLSKEALIARSSGMSYGKWKALQEPVATTPKKNLIKIETNICAYCGCEFTSSTNHKQIYCGDRCRKRRNNEQQKLKYREKVTQTTDDP